MWGGREAGKPEVMGKGNKQAQRGPGTGAPVLSGDRKDPVTASHLVFK